MNGIEFINISKETEEIKFINKLTTTEMRLLTRDNIDVSVPFLRESSNDYIPKSDFNSSFVGSLIPESIIGIAQENDLNYPIDLLKEIGLDIEEYNSVIDDNDSSYISLNLLKDDDIKLLEEN